MDIYGELHGEIEEIDCENRLVHLSDLWKRLYVLVEGQ